MNADIRMLVALALVGPICLGGCSGSGLETVPVYGNVVFVGRDAPKVCRLFFQPLKTTGPLRPSITSLQENGDYQVKAFRGSSGLLPGTYRVRISYYDLKPGVDPNLEESWIEHTYDAGELIVDAGSRGVEHNIEVPSRS